MKKYHNINSLFYDRFLAKIYVAILSLVQIYMWDTESDMNI